MYIYSTQFLFIGCKHVMRVIFARICEITSVISPFWRDCCVCVYLGLDVRVCVRVFVCEQLYYLANKR